MPFEIAKFAGPVLNELLMLFIITPVGRSDFFFVVGLQDGPTKVPIDGQIAIVDLVFLFGRLCFLVWESVCLFNLFFERPAGRWLASAGRPPAATGRLPAQNSLNRPELCAKIEKSIY